MKKKVNLKAVFNVAVILLSLSILGILCVSENGLSDLTRAVKTLDKGWLLMGILCQVINILIDAYLTYRLTVVQSKGYSFGKGLKSCMVGQFFSAVTPFSASQPMQVYLMSKQGVAPGISTAALTQRFLVFQTSLTTYSVIAIAVRFHFFKATLSPFIWGFAAIGFVSQTFLIAVLVLFSFNRRLTHLLLTFGAKLLAKMHLLKEPERKISAFECQLFAFHESNRKLFKNSRLVLESYVFTAVQLTAMFIIPYCIYRSFGLQGARVVDMVCSQVLVSMSSDFVPLPGSVGASELNFMGFFQMFFTQNTLRPALLLWRIITYYGTVLCGAPFSHLGKQKPGNQSNIKSVA